MTDEEDITWKWKDIKQYLEENEYDLDPQDWGEVAEKIRTLDYIEYGQMNKDMMKILSSKEWVDKLIKKQKDALKIMGEI